VYWDDGGQRLFYSLGEVDAWLGGKPNIGGKREGAGRPAPLGRKEVASVRLTPDVAEFCRRHPEGLTVLEKKLRASREFCEWLKARYPAASLSAVPLISPCND
jgi:hypothetical protein